MTTSPISLVLETWHRFVDGAFIGDADPAAVLELLADDVVFWSPVVFRPQEGKEITAMYLGAAARTLGSATDADGNPAFRYTKEVASGDTAVLEFETLLDGKYVNGVDIIRCNEASKIVEFRVMIRPLQAVNAVHSAMAAMLEAFATPPS